MTDPYSGVNLADKKAAVISIFGVKDGIGS